VLIDPPDPDEDGWRTVDLLEPFAGVWLTNRNHSRAAAAFRDRYGLTVWAHAADADRLEAGADERVTGGTTIAGDVEIVPVPGKSPGEIAFHLPRSDRRLATSPCSAALAPTSLSGQRNFREGFVRQAPSEAGVSDHGSKRLAWGGQRHCRRRCRNRPPSGGTAARLLGRRRAGTFRCARP
jgi:hypothetical protein